MKSKISTGIWLVFFGIIALLDNFNIIDFNFYAIIKYWPLLIVSLGINLIFQYKNYGTAVIIALNMALCLFLAYVGYTSTDKFNWSNKVVLNNMANDTTGSEQSVEVPYSDEIKEPKFTLNIGAALVDIDSNTNQLIEANSQSKSLGFNLNRIEDNFELNAAISDKSAKSHKINLALNSTPLWKMTFNIGAAKFNADFSAHKFSRMEINSGAANVTLKLGQPALDDVKIEINTAASTARLSLPKDVACAIDMTTILSNNKLEGFTKKDGVWQTDNYETAAKKYNVELNGAANSLKIDRY
ncbi:MAG TPA: DUF5668 domain-containing protein [Sphingobacterium bovisgrunnientis]|jgi:hypothetical protein|uniref:LiaI-LiaF-like domain-containing protein n=1 Tax=Sphingobacterium bovisgrunnientis TaxID=1874697 RepID=UPI00135966B2|nr:DUF5668 domain-containing protein [Sphingobacterium bovisgrunnientis]HLS36728.1 DUF5668 domain-containing protein [Sphingobacterium bovisgrunnientis]